MQSHSYQRFLNSNATIYSANKTQDNLGGVKQTWAKVYWDVPCRIYGFSGQYQINLEGQTYPVTSKVMFEEDVDLKVGNKLSIRGDEYIVLKVETYFTVRDASHVTAFVGNIVKG